MTANLHSVHVDLVEAAQEAGYTPFAASRIASAVAPVDAVSATIAALERPLTAREETVDILTDLLRCMVRDGVCTARLEIDGLSRREWDELQADEVNGFTKRETFKSLTGAVVATVDYMTDEERAR